MALSPEQLAVVNSNSVWTAKLVRITYGSNVIRYTDHYADITVPDDGTYLADNEILGVVGANANARVNEGTLSFRFGVVDAGWRGVVLSGDLLGARFSISRVILNEQSGAVIGDPIPRFAGIIFGLDVEDDYDGSEQQRPFEVAIDVRPESSELKTSPSVSTNSQSQHRFNSSDNIFSLVEASANKNVVLI